MPDQFDIAIREGQIVTPDGIVTGDMGVREGVIAAIAPDLGPAAKDIDASGRWVMPGGVDVHAHIEQMSGMGLMNADTFETATRSAAIGGTTSVISFAAQAKGQRLSDAMADYSARAERGAMIDYAFHMIVSDTTAPDVDADLGALIDAGNRSIKVFTTYNIQLNDAEILRVMSVARAHGALVCVHAENDAIIARAKAALIAAGNTAPHFHAASHPRMAEVEAVARICRFAEHLGQPVMLFHISTAEGAAIVRDARRRGAPVWAETCPHYLFMTEEILKQDGINGAKWMCSPPQRTKADQEALWQALDQEDLQIVSSDHAPYRFDERGKLSAGPSPGFHEIANGLPGLETRLPLMFDAMVSRGRGGPEAFAQLTATAPAQIYGLPRKGALVIGNDADITVWDPENSVTYGEDDLHDNVGYNPWVGYSMKGWPTDVFLRGAHIVENGQFAGTPGAGRKIDRPTLPLAPTTPVA
ncbi:dihydropyrimidinase [Cognatiyoonia sp. IB215446]|uniref:dihydropyrimidinase n=1 Tax=Cognatiyoonia sp. IB215446 TaxID=3097355 RepID=UPI002A0C68B7|nr:dihydropyrimidinase [Cognatiyoonia sp. IB215446]MDX8349101.1 dihydropyrimidinase [Cognatiyoonia sp. IB215446]